MTRVAVVCDLPEEGWESMDFTGAMVLRSLAERHADTIAPERFCPPFHPRLTRWPVVGNRGAARNVDRLCNRMHDYPRALRAAHQARPFDLYHIVDHSYSQLVHAVPSGRAIITCHDLDTFRSVLEPEREPRPFWFRAMARRILSGFRNAAAIACNSIETRNAVISHGLQPAERVHVVYLGTHPDCSPEADPDADEAAARLLGPARGCTARSLACRHEYRAQAY